MSDAPLSIPEKAALLALMTFVDEVPNPKIRARYGFSIDGKILARLKGDGYLGAERDRARPGRPFVLHLEDKGWRWCRDELGKPPTQEAPRAYRLLYGVLNNIDLYLQRSTCRFEDIFYTDGSPGEVDGAVTTATPGHATDPAAIDDRIRAAYHELVSEPRGWVGLRRLRERLGDVPRADLDAALLRLGLRPDVYLEREVNQKTLTDDDWAAAIRVGGEPRHLLSIEGS